ncbi:MAG: hypothetical protein AAGJ38_01805 [Planctomycetota bacterium]
MNPSSALEHPIRTPLVLAAALLAILSPTGASANSFVSPGAWNRGDPLTTFQYWDSFEDTTGNLPDVADNNPNGSATLSETTGGAFPTSTGNLYSLATQAAFEVTLPVADLASPEPYDLTLLMQVSTFGNVIDETSPKVNGVEAMDFARLQDGVVEQMSTELPDQTWFLFNVPYDAFADGSDNVAELTITFNASDTSMSLEQLLIDTALRPASQGFFDVVNPVAGPSLEGDFNDSGTVEQGDLNLVLSNWGGPRGEWANADGFATPSVDQEELNRVLNNWGSGKSPDFRGVAVPEPAAGLVLGVAAFVLWRRCNRDCGFDSEASR